VLRLQRDRFIGFAFAGGDLLLETDPDGQISYVAGAAKTISGHDNDSLIGKRLPDLVFPDLAGPTNQFLKELKDKGRVLPCKIAFEGVGGRWLTMSGFANEDRPETLQLSFRIDMPDGSEDRSILDADHFKNQLLDQLQSDEKQTLTMVDISELESWSDEAAASCRREIGKSLHSLSGDDGTTGWLDDSVLGIAQGAEIDLGELESAVRTHSKIADPNGVGLTPKIASLPMDSSGLNPGDAGQALLYAINRFAETKGEGFKISSLKSGFDSMVQETVQRVVEVRETVDRDDVELHFQPIVDLKSRTPHHYEVLSRLKDGNSPFELVCFAEQVGLIAEFDLMVCRRVIALLEQRKTPTTPLAVNLSARSMESQAFGKALLALLGRYPKRRGQLMFELTESAAITNPEPVAALIKTLRQSSYKVCLDDFGSGAAAFHYLRAFTFDYVKIDGAYVRSNNKRDHGILKGMATLCQELGVASVAEMIENNTQAERLKRLGVDFGQGYLFGRPTTELD
jgi:EAL domain-containing protein (putative c-di-GMP-specific phosphodiesterase class I)